MGIPSTPRDEQGLCRRDPTMSPVRDGSWDGKRVKPVICEVDRVRRMAETTCITPAVLTSFAGSLSRFSGTTSAASGAPHCLHGALRSFKRVPDAIKTVGASRTGIAAAQRSGISRAAAREAARYCCSLLAGILLPDGRTEVMRARVRKSPAADDEVAGSRGARVIARFPRHAVAPPRARWRRALRWLRYGTSGIW